MKSKQNESGRQPQLPAALSDGRIVGVVEKIEYTRGGAGNQWTTISGARYATWWDLRDKDWADGDVVSFTPGETVLFHGNPPVPQASNLRKFDVTTLEDYQYGALFLNGRERDVIAAALALLGHCMENSRRVAAGGDAGAAILVEPNDGDIGDIMTCSGKHRGMTMEEVDAFRLAILDGKIIDWGAKLSHPRAQISVESEEG